MHLVADILDEQLQDNGERNAGRVDGIILELREGRPPRVAYVEVSPITLFERFNRRFARWYARRIDHKLEGRGVPFRIPWSRIERRGQMLRLDFDATSTPIYALENWLRRHIVDRIPWS